MAPESSLKLLPEEKDERRLQVRNMIPADILNSKDTICEEIYMLNDTQSS
jgi:hypothetical protein